MTDLSAPREVLVIMAHPDDPEFFAGGTVARWVDEGKVVRYLLVTSGDKGNDDATMTTEAVMSLRESEQLAAAKTLGVSEVLFLRCRDGEVVPDLALRRQLVRMIRRLRPDIVVTTDPTRTYVGDVRINHPDHRAVGDLVFGAVFPAASNPRFFPELWQVEGLAPHAPREVWVAGPDQPNHEVEIGERIERKIEAIRCHQSQLKDPEALLARVRQRALQPDGRHVEFFRRIVLQ